MDYYLSFIGFFGMGWFSLFIVLISEKSNENFISLTVSVALTINQFFIVIAPSLFGILIDIFKGYKVPFFLVAILICIGSIWLKISENIKENKVSHTDTDLSN
ncbi:MFS family permease [Neobacillus sp. B4I6]|uniref:MFS transporter n=1 Tax=Neobacillus sp. B4I6 TaxID=3373925 RepID=UPI003D1B5342